MSTKWGWKATGTCLANKTTSFPFTRRLANDAFAVCWFLITAVLQNHFVRRQKPKKLQTNNILQQKMCTFASKQKHKKQWRKT